MPQTEAVAPLEVIVNRTLNAPRERVFRAWTTPAEVNRWFSPDAEATVSTSIDLRVGGKYRIDMERNGKVVSAVGVYREITPPERLVFTWVAEGGMVPSGETLVTVEFFDVDGKTQVTLTHQNFASEEARARHESGWNRGMDRLAQFV